MSNEDPLFQTYRDKSDSLQRSIIIFLGIAFFFFFMVLMPHYSLKVDEYKVSNLYELLNKTKDDIRYVGQAVSNQQKQQYSNLNQQINNYLSQITNPVLDNKTLRTLEDPRCKGLLFRSSNWINCNFNIKNENVQGTLHATVRFNDTTTKRIQLPIATQIELIDKSDGFLATGKLLSLRDTLENLSSTGGTPINLRGVSNKTF